eukprot:Skav208357  [mRNA]  locus=scaffold1964:312945:315711:+ [translate_table: standard]
MESPPPSTGPSARQTSTLEAIVALPLYLFSKGTESQQMAQAHEKLSVSVAGSIFVKKIAKTDDDAGAGAAAKKRARAPDLADDGDDAAHPSKRAKAKAKAKVKAKAKAKGKAANENDGDAETAEDLEADVIMPMTGGQRQRKWLDDLLSCIHRAVGPGMDPFEEYGSTARSTVISQAIGVGLRFAFTGSIHINGKLAPDLLHVLGRNAKFFLRERQDGGGWILSEKVVSVMTSCRALYMLEACKQLLIHKHGKKVKGPGSGTMAYLELVDCDPAALYVLLDRLTSLSDPMKEHILEAEGSYYITQAAAMMQGCDDHVSEWAQKWTQTLLSATGALMAVIKKHKDAKKDLSDLHEVLDLKTCRLALPKVDDVFGNGKAGKALPAPVPSAGEAASAELDIKEESSKSIKEKRGSSIPEDDQTVSFSDLLTLNETNQKGSEVSKDGEGDSGDKHTKIGLTAPGALYIQNQLEMMFLKRALNLAIASGLC